MARVVTAPKLALLNGSRLNFHARALVEDGDGVLKDTTALFGIDFFDGASWTENIDQPVASGSITLRREGTTSAGVKVSLAPSMAASPANRKIDTSYSPWLVAGRRVQILVAWTVADVAPVAGDWMLMFDGKIDTVNWKGLEPSVSLDIRDRGGWLQDTFIEEVRTYSDTTGVPVESVMQQILDDNPNAKLGAVTLYVPTSPGWNIRAYSQDQKSVLDALRDLAQQIGWDVRYRWREATAQFELTLFQPDRAKSASDWTLSGDQYLEVTDLKQTDANVRNRIRVRTQAPDGTEIISLAVDAASVTKFGPRFMGVAEDATSNIDTQAEADAMSAAMLADLKDPIADQEIENLLYPIAQLGDLGTWSANGKQYDSDQQFAVIQVRHDVTREKRRTFIQSRGRVAGAFNAWLAIEATEGDGTTLDTRALALKNFREVRRTPTTVTFAWDPVGDDVAEIWAWGKLSPQDADPPLPPGTDEDRLWRDTKTETPDRVLDNTTTEFEVAVPDFGFVQTWELLPVDASGKRGYAQRVKVLSVPDVPRITSIETVEGASGLFKDIIALNVVDPQALGGTLRAWLNHDAVEDANPTDAPDGTITVALTPRTFVVADVFTVAGGTAQLFDNVRIHPGAGKRIYFEFINSRGISSGVVQFILLSNGGIIDENGILLDASINRAEQVAATMTLPSVYDSLPAVGRANELALLTTDVPPKLYRWTGSTWTAEVPTVDLVGQVSTAQIAANAVTTAKIAAGAVQTAQIGTAAITTALVAGGAITTALIAAGAVTTTTIADGAISTPKLVAGAVTANELAAGSVIAGKIGALAITAAELAAGSVVAGKVAAGAVTAGTIAAGTVTATEIAALAITAGKIAANAVTATEVAANAITAGKVAANAITSGTIAANAVTSGTILAGAVTATAIAAGAVTAVKLSITLLSEVSTDAGVIVAGKLQSVDGLRYLDLNATGSNPFLQHPSLALRSDGTATFSGALSAASGTFAGSVTAAGTIAASAFTAATLTLSATDAIVEFTGVSAFATSVGIRFARSGAQATIYAFYASSVVGLALTAGGNIVLNPGTGFNVSKLSNGGATVAVVPGVTIAAGAPSSPGNYRTGDLWCDTSNLRIHVLSGGAWVQTTT